MKNKVLIAGIGGASLGTEILKCLKLSGGYEVFGCDISKLAYGHYMEDFKDTFIVDLERYVESILDFCVNNKIDFIIPGGEEPMVLLNESAEKIKAANIKLAMNSFDVIKNFSNKKRTFEILSKLNIAVPLTTAIASPDEIQNIKKLTFPLVVKPAEGSGGSNFVFLASDADEASLYVNYLLRNGRVAVAQEYLSEKEGEFTVGVLSLPNKEIACSVALKRVFNSKLSIFAKTKAGLISSGNSQGIIDDFPEICTQAENIARAIHSEGPINIQGRIRKGVLMPFEINPRFSASCYLRAMAGVNEVDFFLQYLIKGSFKGPVNIKAGYYLRSFAEVFADKERLKK